MMATLLIILTLLPCTLSKSTIETNKLFQNTVKRWNIDIVSRRDHAERYRRLVNAQQSVEKTTSGVVLESLNRLTVMNDKEFEEAVGPLIKGRFNLTMDTFQEEEYYQPVKRDESNNTETTIPTEYMYWMNTVGFPPVGDQASCGSCWIFPAVAAMEALYTETTGEAVKFSEQYFVDCARSTSGCGGGETRGVYDLMKRDQYLRTAELSPYTADYIPCTYKVRDEKYSFTNNGMKKMWLTEYYPVGKNEESALKALIHSPVAFGTYISMDMYSYSGGLFEDHLCASHMMAHAMLLVGYKETFLLVRNSYGDWIGYDGYITYKRGSGALPSCRFFQNAFFVKMEVRRDIEYAFCNDMKMSTRTDCIDSCSAMNTKTESGWTLAIIPTRYHGNLVTRMVTAQFPEVKKDDKFNWFWMGIQLQQSGDGTYNYVRLDNMPVTYSLFISAKSFGKKYVLVNKYGAWTYKSSNTLMARGLCSRAINCWNIDTAVTNGKVSFSDDSLKEGTVATVTCVDSFSLVGTNLLACVAGHWDADLPLCVKKEQKEGDKKEEMEEEKEKDKKKEGEEEVKKADREEDGDDGAGKKEEDKKEEKEENEKKGKKGRNKNNKTKKDKKNKTT